MDFTVCELFAGVGGFRLGLEKTRNWKVIWANQWEPASKQQHAYNCYLSHFPEDSHNKWMNVDIAEVTAALSSDSSVVPDHTLLVGGFPCQDYSVATTQAKGMVGKKGVLWWEIEKIVRMKRPPYVLLENVDRLLSSPAKQRGRDMGILLGCMRDLGYSVEWRVINAADYGFPQKRRRVFIFAFRDDTLVAKQLNKKGMFSHKWLQKDGFFASEFPVKYEAVDHDKADDFEWKVQRISDKFNFKFHNSGIMSKGKLYTLQTTPMRHNKLLTLRDVLQHDIDVYYFVDENDIDRHKGWKYVKGAKREERVAKTGFTYNYTEGAIPFPEDLDSPSRTILTNEGNRNPNRCSHLIQDPNNGRYRILTPVEAERLNGFPDNWTDTGMPLSRRYFCMGNALVVGLVERMGNRLSKMVEAG